LLEGGDGDVYQTGLEDAGFDILLMLLSSPTLVILI